MDFALTSDQIMFCDSVRGFAEKHLAAGALARAHQEEHPWDVSKLIAEQGLMGIAMKEEDGGQGGTLMDAILAMKPSLKYVRAART
jgi:alkylation response protein AidB-like acyl-CoA dehydrogenase